MLKPIATSLLLGWMMSSVGAITADEIVNGSAAQIVLARKCEPSGQASTIEQRITAQLPQRLNALSTSEISVYQSDLEMKIKAFSISAQEDNCMSAQRLQAMSNAWGSAVLTATQHTNSALESQGFALQDAPRTFQSSLTTNPAIESIAIVSSVDAPRPSGAVTFLAGTTTSAGTASRLNAKTESSMGAGGAVIELRGGVGPQKEGGISSYESIF